MPKFYKRAFSLIEVLIVISVLAILAAAGSGYYRNYMGEIQLDSAVGNLTSDLKIARAKAMSGEDDRRWGIHFVNGTEDYYEVFSTPDNYSNPGIVIDTTTHLSFGAVFTNPTEGNSKDVIFDKIKGSTASTTIVISSDIFEKTITISSEGNIY